LQLFLKQKQFPDAVRIAMKLADQDRVGRVFELCTDAAVKKQVAFLLGKQQFTFDSGDEELNELVCDGARVVEGACAVRWEIHPHLVANVTPAPFGAPLLCEVACLALGKVLSTVCV
jgi:hypothetical protein